MPFFVYIIQSNKDKTFYKGFSEQPLIRLLQHNNGDCSYTSNKRPWKLIFIEELPDKRAALIRERTLKKYSHNQIQNLIESPKNILNKFID